MLLLVRLAHPVHLSIPADAQPLVQFFSYLAETRMESEGVDKVSIHPSTLWRACCVRDSYASDCICPNPQYLLVTYVDSTDSPRLSPSSLSSPLSATLPTSSPLHPNPITRTLNLQIPLTDSHILHGIPTPPKPCKVRKRQRRLRPDLTWTYSDVGSVSCSDGKESDHDCRNTTPRCSAATRTRTAFSLPWSDTWETGPLLGVGGG